MLQDFYCCSQIVGAVDKNFLGVVPPDSTEFPPKILFSTDPYNPTAPLTQLVYDASSIQSDITVRQNLTVPLCVKAGASEGRFTQLTNVSFTASWKKDPVILYRNPSIIASAQNLNPNAVHGIWMPTSYGDYFLCNLTFLNVPDGNQQIEVTAVKEGIYINWTTVPSAPTYWAFSMTNSAIFPFVTPTPTPQPTQTPQPAQVTPTPTVPELSWLMLLTLFAFTLAVTIKLKRKTTPALISP